MSTRRSIRSNKSKAIVFLGIAVSILLSGPVLAADLEYPAKPVTINLGMAPGGGGSVTAHIFAEGVQKYLAKPQPFIVSHRPGASGIVCADYVMKQPIDGYNLLYVTVDTGLRMA